MAAGGDKDLWNDLFGGNDSADARAQPPTTAAASSAPEKKEKDKKDKKEKKEKKDGKEKKDKKEKDKDGKKEAAPMPSPVEVVEPAPVAEPVKEAEPAKKDKKAGKDKDKKEKKEKKEKKAKKDKGGGEGAELPDITTPLPDSETPVLLPVIEDSQPAPAMEEVTQPIEKKGKEKKDKDKKDKKEKKEKKDKPREAEDPDGKPDDGKPDDEKKEKKAKKDKKDKEDKKEKKKEKKEGKEKKRKAETEINEEDDKRPKLDDEVTEIPDGQEAPLVETADNLYDEFDISKDLVAVEEEDPFGNIDIFDDVFAQAFAGIDEPEPEAVVPAPTAEDDKGFGRRPRVEMPIVAAFFAKKKDKDAEKLPETQGAEQPEESISTRWSQVMDHCKVKRALAISEQDSVPYIQDFIRAMVQASEDDLADFQRGSPMLHKMRLLPKAISIMQKYAFAEIFVIYEGCSALAKWMMPLPNGELPNVQLRTNLLQCMMRLPITKETLTNCKGVPLGSVVAKLQNNNNETVSNRKLAGMLVQKWLKQVLSKSQMDGFDLDNLVEADLPKATIPRPPAETDESLRELEAESATRMHPKIPILEGKMYQIQPMPKDMPMRREKKNLDSNRGKLAEVLKVMCRPNKRSWKPYQVSVAGRTINAV